MMCTTSSTNTRALHTSITTFWPHENEQGRRPDMCHLCWKGDPPGSTIWGGPRDAYCRAERAPWPRRKELFGRWQFHCPGRTVSIRSRDPTSSWWQRPVAPRPWRVLARFWSRCLRIPAWLIQGLSRRCALGPFSTIHQCSNSGIWDRHSLVMTVQHPDIFYTRQPTLPGRK